MDDNMQSFKNILVITNPLRNISTAVKPAVELAHAEKARLTVLDVSRDLPPELCNHGSPSEKKMCEFRASRKTQIELQLEDEGIACPADIRIITGMPCIEIISRVLKDHHDLLIKQAEFTKNRLTSAGLADMDKHLLRKCPAPVWLVKPARWNKHRRILAAVNPELTELNAGLNGQILRLAATLAAWQDAELHIVSAWTLIYEVELRSRPKQINTNLLIKDFHKTYKRWLHLFAEPYMHQGIKYHLHAVNGKKTEVIQSEARKRHADLIIIGTSGRTGIRGFFIGNTVERILPHVNCSVLALKPEDFNCPVEV